MVGVPGRDFSMGNSNQLSKCKKKKFVGRKSVVGVGINVC